MLWRLCWCQCNLFHLVPMDNECLNQFWTFKNSTLGKCILIIFLLWKWVKYIFVLKRCLELGVLLWNQLKLLYSIRKEIGVGAPWGPLFLKFLLFIRGKKILNQNNVKFDFSIGHALVLFQFFWIINKKCTVEYVPPQNSYILIYFGHKTLFSPNLLIIFSLYFRNTSNYSK